MLNLNQAGSYTLVAHAATPLTEEAAEAGLLNTLVGVSKAELMARLGLAAGGAEAEAASAEQETVKLALSQLLVTKGVSENLQDKILLLAGGSANLAARKDKAGSYLFPTLHHALPVVLKLAELVGTNERHGDGAASPHQSAHPPRYGQINTVELTHTKFSFNLTHLQRSQEYEQKIEQHSQHSSS